MTTQPTDRERLLLDLLSAAVRREQADAERARTYSLGSLMTPAERDRARAASDAAAAELTAAFRALPDDLHAACVDAVYGPPDSPADASAGMGAPS